MSDHRTRLTGTPIEDPPVRPLKAERIQWTLLVLELDQQACDHGARNEIADGANSPREPHDKCDAA